MIRVYRFGLRPPTSEVAALSLGQMKLAHRYRNDLVLLEQGRRWAVRQMHTTREVQEAEALVRSAGRSDRAERLRELDAARGRAEHGYVSDAWLELFAEMRQIPGADLSALDPIDFERHRIKTLDYQARRDARELARHAGLFWGTYLIVEKAADMARAEPIYNNRDPLAPIVPHFTRWDETGAVAMQLQATNPLTTAKAKTGEDTRVRWIREGLSYRLFVRGGSVGRKPVWFDWLVYRGGKDDMREIPDAGSWKWVQVSRRREGPFHFAWTCEITVDLPEVPDRKRDTQLAGSIAVELLWTPLDDGSLRVGVWQDSFGECGEIILSKRIVGALRKSNDIQSIRDQLRNSLAPRLQAMLQGCKEPLPPWLARAASVMHLWRAQGAFHGLARRWRQEKCDAVREAYELLDEWEARDNHLWEYRSCSRSQALRSRKDFYRCTAAGWSRRYLTCAIPDRDLSREARWGDDSDRRFEASPQEVRDCLKAAFGDDCIEVEWRGPHGVDEDSKETWLSLACERARAGQMSDRARKKHERKKNKEVKGGKWARIKTTVRERGVEKDGARKATGNDGE